MTGLGETIPAGIGIIVVLYLALYRFSPLNARHSAFVVSLLSMVVYFPVALNFWPGVDVLVLNITAFLMTSYILGIMFTYREATRRDGGAGKWFHWAPALIVGFFVTILVVDGIFVSVSMKGIPDELEKVMMREKNGQGMNTVFPGVVSDNNFKKESRYNEYLRHEEAFQKAGWKIRKGWLEKTPGAGEEGIFQVIMHDRDGRQITGARLFGRFMRPSDSRKDVVFDMQEVTPGIFQVKVRLHAPGVWMLSLQIEKDTLKYNLRASTTLSANQYKKP